MLVAMHLVKLRYSFWYLALASSLVAGVIELVNLKYDSV